MSAVAAIRNHVRNECKSPFELTFYHIVAIFMLCSFFGLLGESVVSYFRDGHWESRAGFVIGPFSPIYGLGAVLITLALNPLRSRGLLVQFVAAGAVGGGLEYFGGWFFESRYGIVAWSYAGQPFNFHGHTSLLMMAVWGAIGVVWINAIIGHVISFADLVPEGARRRLAIGLSVFILADSVLTIACFDSWFWRMAGYPISNPIQQFCATYFNDDFMRTRFETMSMWTSLASR